MPAHFQFSVLTSSVSASLRLSLQFSVLLLLSAPLPASEPLTLPLWPEGAPGQLAPRSPATDAFIKKHQSKNAVTDIEEPSITVYRPAKPNGTSVIVAPGGGYMFLSAVHEGTQVCEWLNTLGVTGILLKYRTPTRDEPAAHDKPVADAQQALKLIRTRAKEWNLNPNRIGLLGFSAGGNLLAHLACDRGSEKTELPDFGIMIYGGGFLDPKDPNQLAPTFTVPADAPPMFIACAHDDKQNPIAATLLYLEYKKQNLPAELHLFTHGGHGFGMRDNKQPINQWPARCGEWMDSMGWLPTPAKVKSALREKLQVLERLNVEIPTCGSESALMEQRILSEEKRLQQIRQSGDFAQATALEARLPLLRIHLQKLRAQEAQDQPRRVELLRLADELTALRQLQQYFDPINSFGSD